MNFTHRSFLDYFAAFHIDENREEIENLNELIANTYFDDIWSEIAFFYIGLRRKISQDLLEKIYTYPSEKITANLFKLLCGRLLQAGWHSPAQKRVFGIKNAISYAPIVQRDFQEIIDSSDSHIPNILCELIVLSISDLSFNSGFLERHIKELLKQLIDSANSDDIYMAVALFWSIRRFLSSEDVALNIKTLVKKLRSFPDEEQARMLIPMTIIEKDKDAGKLIDQQLSEIRERSPNVFKALLPVKRKGFRH